MDSSGKYKTKQRELIMDYLIHNQKKHVTAENILDYLKCNHTPVGKSTVYRYLEVLIEQNIIRKYTLEDGMSSCFQYISKAATCEEHYHFKCSKCGELFHVSCDLMKGISDHVYKEHHFTIDSSKTVFYGLCEKCTFHQDRS